MTHEMARSIIKQETQEQTADRIIELYQVISEYVAERDRLREALEAVRDMPEYDQDDQYRLREIARAALQEADDD